MSTLLNRSFKFVLFSNIYISFCALAQGLLSYHLLGTNPDFFILSLLFFSTLLVYNIDRVIYSDIKDDAFMTERKQFINKFSFFLKYLVYLSAAVVIVSLFFLPLKVFLVLVPLGLISIAYSVPILTQKGKIPALKYWYGQKAFVIATVWSVACILLPLTSSSVSIPLSELIMLVAGRFLFITVLCVQFDIRDVEQDKANGWNTFPVIFGVKNANRLSYLFLFTFIILLYTNPFYSGNQHLKGMLLSVLLTAIIIFIGRKRSEAYYSFLIDGMMIAQFILVIIF